MFDLNENILRKRVVNSVETTAKTNRTAAKPIQHEALVNDTQKFISYVTTCSFMFLQNKIAQFLRNLLTYKHTL